VYPAIDPGTGGPTGASLLGSTLGIILIFSLVPGLLGLRGPDATAKRLHWISFSVSCAVFALLDRHQSSHHDWRQIAGLASLLVWIPLLANYLRGVHWNESSRPWLISALCWWTLLVVTGFVEFCPGILDRAKFTHALVAHAHLAMAGLLTSFNMLLLNNLGVTSGSLAKRTPFALWHFGLFVHLTSLAALAAFETSTAGWVLQHSSMQVTLYVVRLCAGAIMTAASIWWLADVARDRAMVRA
jgi:cytochrome c oxidase cbb3-type subunit 1